MASTKQRELFQAKPSTCTNTAYNMLHFLSIFMGMWLWMLWMLLPGLDESKQYRY